MFWCWGLSHFHPVACIVAVYGLRTPVQQLGDEVSKKSFAGLLKKYEHCVIQAVYKFKVFILLAQWTLN